MDGVSEEIARQAFALAAAKLPIKTTFVTKDGDVMKAQDLRTKKC